MLPVRESAIGYRRAHAVKVRAAPRVCKLTPDLPPHYVFPVVPRGGWPAHFRTQDAMNAASVVSHARVKVQRIDVPQDFRSRVAKRWAAQAAQSH
jgi:hypothetical protein